MLFATARNVVIGGLLTCFALGSFVGLAAEKDPAVTLSGTVFGPDGKPAAGAEVFLTDGPNVNSRVASLRQGEVPIRPNIVARGQSDEGGAFAIDLFSEVPESDWARTWLVLWVRQPGSALSSYLVGRDWPARAAPLEVRLTAAAPLSFVVVGADGKPVTNARLLPEQVDDVRLPPDLAEQLAATSDDAGHVVLHDVTPTGLDLVRIETDDYGVQWAGVPAADAEGVRPVALLPVGTVRGQLRAADPRAVARVPIRLATWSTADDDSSGGGLAETTTDAEGRFEVPTIAAGALSAALDPHPELAFRSGRISGRPVAAGATNDLKIELERAVRVEGVVRDRDSGVPLAGTAVSLNWFAATDSLSDAQGRFTCFMLPGQAAPSPRRIPRHYCFPQYVLDTQPVPAGTERVELKPLMLARGVTVRGRVVDRKGKGVGGAEVEAHWALASGGEMSAHARGDREGHFAIDGVEPKVQLKLSVFSARGTLGEPADVNASAEKPIELVVDPSNARQMEGRVVDAEKQPLAGAVVRIAWQRRGAEGTAEDEGYMQFEGGQRLVTDVKGRFRTPRVLARGREYRAEVSLSGMLPTTTEFFDPATRKAATLGDLVLDRVPELHVIEGRAVDEQGKAVAGLRVFQAGDGPRGTETTTDEAGHFRLAGLYDGSVFLLAGGNNYPLQGFLISKRDDAKPVQLTVRDEGQPAVRHLRTLDAPLTPAGRREIALRLVKPLAASVKTVGFDQAKFRLMGVLGMLAPGRISEFASVPLLKLMGIGDVTEQLHFHAAAALVREDPTEALAAGEAIEAPYYRGKLYLAACDALPDDERAAKSDLLATALVNARAEPDAGQKVELLGQIAERWLDLGEAERGTSLLREGQKLAEGLPPPSEAAERAHAPAPHARARFAGSLARIDGSAAMKLSTGFTGQFADRYRIVVARGLADHDPVAAERMLDELDYSGTRFWQGLPVLHCLARVDVERAARSARKCNNDAQRGYALGIVAHGVTPHDRARAESLLREAYELLERAAPSVAVGEYPPEHPTVLAAALLPVAERIDPGLVEPYFWRAMALRPGRRAKNGGTSPVTGAMAVFVSRYDRDAARALAQPLAARVQTITVDDDYWKARFIWAALAIVDAAWAESLIDTLPEPASVDLRAAKNAARLQVAETLTPSEGSWWHTLYEQVHGLRDPDQRDDER